MRAARQRLPLLACVLAAIVATAALAGCGGGGSSGAGASAPSGTAQIKALLFSYYEHPSPGKCDQLTTDAYRSKVFGGSGADALAACREHQEDRAEAMGATERTVFVGEVRIKGTEAVAEVRSGGISSTEALVEKHGKWILDDESSPFTHGGEGPAFGGTDEAAIGPLAFGESASFDSIPGIPPATSVKVTAEAPIDPGVDRRGQKTDVFVFGNDFGQPGKPKKARFINLPVKLTNTGTMPFRGEVEAFGFDRSGYEFAPLDPRDITQRGGIFGRLPDWTSGEEKGIAPGASTTRYLTFAVPVGVRIVKWVLKPSVLSRPNTVTSLEPLEGAIFKPGAKPNV